MNYSSIPLATILLMTAPALGQRYHNGGMNPRVGGCNGGWYSVIQAPDNAYGNQTLVTAFHQADDFSVPSGQTWTPTSLKWYLYQTSSPANEPITAVFIQVWRGSQADMLAGAGVLVGGDMVTNRLSGASVFADIYRTTAADRTNCDRAIKECTVDMSWLGPLPAGQYWIEIGSTGNPAFSGPWANHAVRDGDENSLFFNVTLGTWTTNIAGDGVTSWDYPFKLDYLQSGNEYLCAVTGACPGQLSIDWSGAPAQSRQGIVFAANTGSYTIQLGPCAGTVTGMGLRRLQLLGEISTGDGTGTIEGTIGIDACGGNIQLVAAGSPCSISNVCPLP